MQARHTPTCCHGALLQVVGPSSSCISHPDATKPFACAGRILNRFSSDTATADDTLPFTLNILLANLFGLLGSVVVLCLSEPWLVLALLPLALVYKYLQTYYRDTARELRRLNSIARLELA